MKEKPKGKHKRHCTCHKCLKSVLHEHTAYNELFEFFYQEHGLTLLHSQLDDIISAVKQFEKTFNETP